MQKFGIGALVIALIIGAGYLIWPEEANAPQVEVPAPVVTPEIVTQELPTVAITFTDAGYEPKEVSIKKGQRVRFVNNSAKLDTWPASAVHPTHALYPDKKESDCLGSSFDSCRGLKTGESWEFVFNHPGIWRFHDHLHASKTGVITVTE